MRVLTACALTLVTLNCAAADPHSYANSDAVRVRHALIDLEGSFERQVLDGFVELTLPPI